jgi:hypothetical protein
LASIWPPPLDNREGGRRPGSDGHGWRNLILVLEATLNGP